MLGRPDTVGRMRKSRALHRCAFGATAGSGCPAIGYHLAEAERTSGPPPPKVGLIVIFAELAAEHE